MHSLTGRLVVVAALAAVVLTGCSLAPPATGAPTPTLAPVATPAPTPSPTPVPASPTLAPVPSASTVPQASGACTGPELAAILTQWQGAAGSRFGTLQVTDKAAAPCTVSGTPGVQLIDGNGHVFLDSAGLGKPATVSPTDPTLTLPAAAASPLFLSVALSNYCGPAPTGPVTVGLVLPSSLGRLVATVASGVSIDMAPCNGAAGPTVLGIQTGWSTAAP
jgi:Protein of unknown function (DUF4232)